MGEKKVCYADITKDQYTCARYLTLLSVRAIVLSRKQGPAARLLQRPGTSASPRGPPPRERARSESSRKNACCDRLFVIQKMTRDPVHHWPGALGRRPFRRSGGPLPVLFVVSSKTLSHAKGLQDGSLNWRRLQRGRLQKFWFMIPRSVRLLRAAAAP